MRFRRSSLAILLGLAVLVPAGQAVAAPSGSSLFVQIDGCSFSGETSDVTDDLLTVVHRGSGGALKSKHTFDVSGGGWTVDCPGPKVRTGDRIELRQGVAKTLIRTFTVPNLALSTNRGFDRAKGKAPGVSSIDLDVTICDVAGFGCTGLPEVPVPVDPNTHKWTYTQSNDLTGGSYVTVHWAKGANKVSRTQQIAQLIVEPGSAVVTGTGRSGGRGEAITLARGDVFSFANPITRSDASFRATFKRHGTVTKVRKGDVIQSSIAGDATVKVPPTSMALTVDGAQGTCRKNRPVTVRIRDTATGQYLNGSMTTTDSTGHWAVTIPVPPDVTVEAWCATVAGDVILRRLSTN